MGSLEATDQASAEVATAPRVTLAQIKSRIAAEMYVTGKDIAVFADVRILKNYKVTDLCVLTVCVLVLDNGFTVLGKAAPAVPANYNKELGRQFAYEDAVRQIWPLEGYLLKESMAS